ELLSFFRDRGIISAFSRLHPLLENHSIFGNLGQIVTVNLTVAIDLRQSLEDQRKQFRKSNKSELNQLRRKGFHVKEATTKEEIDKFVQIYYQTMDRVKASSLYYFDHEYFHRFLNNPCFDSKLLLAIHEGEIAAGAIFTMSDTIMQYHLAGTEFRFIPDTPMKLIIDEARMLGTSFKMKYLHLGGGVGGSDVDSLFKFKSGFSNLRFQYRVWKMIVDEDAYDRLVEERGFKEREQSEFFPLYRLNIN